MAFSFEENGEDSTMAFVATWDWIATLTCLTLFIIHIHTTYSSFKKSQNMYESNNNDKHNIHMQPTADFKENSEMPTFNPAIDSQQSVQSHSEQSPTPAQNSHPRQTTKLTVRASKKLYKHILFSLSLSFFLYAFSNEIFSKNGYKKKQKTNNKIPTLKFKQNAKGIYIL